MCSIVRTALNRRRSIIRLWKVRWLVTQALLRFFAIAWSEATGSGESRSHLTALLSGVRSVSDRPPAHLNERIAKTILLSKIKIRIRFWFVSRQETFVFLNAHPELEIGGWLAAEGAEMKRQLFDPYKTAKNSKWCFEKDAFVWRQQSVWCEEAFS